MSYRRSRDFVPEPFPRTGPLGDLPVGHFRPQDGTEGEQEPFPYDDWVKECPICGELTDLLSCPACGENTITLPGAVWEQGDA